MKSLHPQLDQSASPPPPPPPTPTVTAIKVGGGGGRRGGRAHSTYICARVYIRCSVCNLSLNKVGNLEIRNNHSSEPYRRASGGRVATLRPQWACDIILQLPQWVHNKLSIYNHVSSSWKRLIYHGHVTGYRVQISRVCLRVHMCTCAHFGVARWIRPHTHTEREREREESYCLIMKAIFL